jgi:hypothetical protein
VGGSGIDRPASGPRQLREVSEELQDLAAWLHRERLGGDEALRLLKEVASVENTCAAVRVLLSGRIAEGTSWQKKGDRTAAHFLARATKTTVGHAVGTLEDGEAP